MHQNIQPSHVDQGKRSHREAELDRRRVDFRCGRPFLQQRERLLQVRHEHAIDQEPLAVLDQHRRLVHGPAQLDRRRQRLARRGLAADDLDQRHPLGRIEEVQPDQPVRMAQAGGQFVQGDRGRVRGQDRVRRADFFQAVAGPSA